MFFQYDLHVPFVVCRGVESSLAVISSLIRPELRHSGLPGGKPGKNGDAFRVRPLCECFVVHTEIQIIILSVLLEQPWINADVRDWLPVIINHFHCHCCRTFKRQCFRAALRKLRCFGDSIRSLVAWQTINAIIQSCVIFPCDNSLYSFVSGYYEFRDAALAGRCSQGHHGKCQFPRRMGIRYWISGFVDHLQTDCSSLAQLNRDRLRWRFLIPREAIGSYLRIVRTDCRHRQLDQQFLFNLQANSKGPVVISCARRFPPSRCSGVTFQEDGTSLRWHSRNVQHLPMNLDGLYVMIAEGLDVICRVIRHVRFIEIFLRISAFCCFTIRRAGRRLRSRDLTWHSLRDPSSSRRNQDQPEHCDQQQLRPRHSPPHAQSWIENPPQTRRRQFVRVDDPQRQYGSRLHQ